MNVPEHLVSWAAAIRNKGKLPTELSDGTGRDAALPEKIARRLSDLGLIKRVDDGRAWALTAEGLKVAGARA